MGISVGVTEGRCVGNTDGLMVGKKMVGARQIENLLRIVNCGKNSMLKPKNIKLSGVGSRGIRAINLMISPMNLLEKGLKKLNNFYLIFYKPASRLYCGNVFKIFRNIIFIKSLYFDLYQRNNRNRHFL